MKKILIVILTLALALSVVACSSTGSDSADSLEGTTWVLSSIVAADGTEYSGEDVAFYLGGDSYYTFEADGVLIAEIFGNVIEGHWSSNGDEVGISANGATSVYTLNGNEMVLEGADGSVSVMTLT